MNLFKSQLHLWNIAIPLLVSVMVTPLAQAEDWLRVSSADGKVSALFPEDIRKNKQSQVERTIAGRVTTYFGEFHGDGIILAGSVAELPKLARKRHRTVFETTKRSFLKEAEGSEVSFRTTTADGVPARELVYEGRAYRGKGDPYKGHALIFIFEDRLYILNAVISGGIEANEGAKRRLLGSLRVAK